MQGSWRVTIAGALQDKTSNLTRQLACDSNSCLIPVARSSRQNALFDENWPFTFLMHPTINILIPTKCRELPEKILREKQREFWERNLRKKQDWLIHNLHLLRGFSPNTSVSFSITYRHVIFVFASLFPYSLPFNYCCVYD